MRWLLLSLLLVAPAVAHSDHGSFETGAVQHGAVVEHTLLVTTELGVNESTQWTLGYQGGPFAEDWIWLLRADVQGAVRLDASLDGRHLTTWNWGTGPHVDFKKLPREGLINLTATNLVEENTTVSFYFDQTCECIGKVIPLNSGPAWFNVDAEEGQRVHINFTIQPTGSTDTASLPDNLIVRATYFTLDEFGGLVDQERSRRTFSPVNDTACHQPAPYWNGCIDLDFTALHDGMQLVWFDVIHDGDTDWDMAIRPVVEYPEPERYVTPLPWWTALALLAAYRRAT